MPINIVMSYRIRCYTLFDITQTGVTSRTKLDNNIPDWLHARNTQCNFDTILQIISLRSQPEVVRKPERIELNLKEFGNFGVSYKSKNTVSCWTFDFEVHHASVFDNNDGKLGSLYTDCSSVPMIKSNTESINLSNFLNNSSDLKNIHFEII